MSTIRYPGGFTVTARPDARGYHRLRGPDCDRRIRSFAEAEQEAWRLGREVCEQARPVSGHTVADLIDLYLSGAGRGRPLAPNTLRTMRSNLNRHALPVIGDLDCSAWDRAATVKVVQACEKAGLADSSIGKVVRDLSAVARVGRQVGWMAEEQEPCKGLMREQSSALLRGSLPGPDDIVRLAEAMVEANQGESWRALQVYLLAYAGLRSSELLALRPEDVNGGVIHVERQLVGRKHTLPKHGKTRDTIYPAWLDADLQGWADSRPEGAALFPGYDGREEPYSTWLRNRWQPAAMLARVPRRPDGRLKWTAHTLRHYFGTWALSPDGLNLDIADVALFMGHSSPEVTHRLYVQSRPDRFARARAASRKAGR